jgi:L-iditol 2-dehydrogenase
MKAAILYGKEDVRVEDATLPPLREGEVRLQIKAALTCGTDLKVFKRGYHARMIVPPALFGHELAGVISELGPGVSSWSTGDRVVVANSAPCGHCFFCAHQQENLCEDLLFLNGGYAQEINVPARIVATNMLRLEAETDFRDAALTEPLACEPGERVLILGAGPIGLMFVALLKKRGCTVTIGGRGAERLAAARRLGADQVIELVDDPRWLQKLRSESGHPHDIVVEAVGKPDVWEAALQVVRKGGRVNFFGGCPAGTSVSLDTGLIHYSNLTLLASFHHTPAAIREALGYIKSGLIHARDFVGAECALSQMPELFQQMTRGNRVVKTFIDVSR